MIGKPRKTLLIESHELHGKGAFMKNFDVSRLFQIIFACVFALSAFMVVFLLLRAYREQKAFENLAEMVDKNIGVPEDLSSEMPESEEVSPYIRLKEQNDDFYGWISIEGTRVDYPVMHTPDNPEYYLRRGFDGNWAESGVPFMSAECFDGCGNYLIHGHNMKNGTMFADILSYSHKEFYQEHPVIRFDTLEDEREYHVMAAFFTQVTDGESNDFPYYQYTDLTNQKIFEEYLQRVSGAALYDTGITAKYKDALITLSTCSYHADNGRFVVVAREIKE